MRKHPVMLVLLGLVLVGAIVGRLPSRNRLIEPVDYRPARYEDEEFRSTVFRVNQQFQQAWDTADVPAAPPATQWQVMRRLSLALTGTIPSLEEIRAADAIPRQHRVPWWLDRLLDDRRYSDYLAERLARVYVGTEDGPFIIYRRRRFVSWLSDQLHTNRPYDELVQDLIAGTGLWTDNPAVNFLTVTTDVNGDEQPDEERLAARTARAFLGLRLDCVQCHDDHLDGDWRQQDFHQLAAFFSEAKSTPLGVQNEQESYEYQFLGEAETVQVMPQPPFAAMLLPAQGYDRQRLAAWVTHTDNSAFSRAIVNRVWATLFGKPLVNPIDDIPLSGPYPPGLETLAEDFADHGFDLRRLIRLVASTRPFALDSRYAGGVSTPQEEQWAAFPISRLRPEQVAGSLLQASSLKTIDAQSHILVRLARYEQQKEFVQRFGDRGEDEFSAESGTIPQRLLMMNGQLVHDRTKEDLVGNAVSRIATLARDQATAIDAAYQTVLTPLPSTEEKDYFLTQMETSREQDDFLRDLVWVLLNSTEFSWNH